MESSAIISNKIEQIQITIQQLIESKQVSSTQLSIGDADHDHHLLLELLSQLESMKEEVANQSEALVEPKEVPVDKASEVETKSRDETETSKRIAGVETEDVVEELKKLGKQNRTTHWLLSALIVLTVAWQVSEVSLLLKLKGCFSNPLKSIGRMLVKFAKRRTAADEAIENGSLLTKVNGSEMPFDLPNMNLSGLISNKNDEEE